MFKITKGKVVSTFFILLVLAILVTICMPNYSRYKVRRRGFHHQIQLPPPSSAINMPVKEDKGEAPNIIHNTELYNRIYENPFLAVKHNAFSTFSIDVDTASYSNTRRFINLGQLPPPGAVRIEEMLNYFDYTYPEPSGAHPLSMHVEISRAPWKKNHLLAKIGLKGREISDSERAGSNLVFLIDVSGSMASWEKLPLVKRSLEALVSRLDARDRVGIVVYASAEGVELRSTSGASKERIIDAIDSLSAGGSTNGGAGIALAYEMAEANFIENGNNRVIIATDGDFNVGITSPDELTRLIEKKAAGGVFLTTLGFGMGNYKDATLEQLADLGNGNHAYIDSFKEAKKVLVEEMIGTLYAVAKDVKLQIEFNPSVISAFRLIGYENRVLRTEDFNNDKKDAGELGSGGTVTALYELVPVGEHIEIPGVDEPRYRNNSSLKRNPASQGEILNLKLRYKLPKGEKSRRLEMPIAHNTLELSRSSKDFRYAAAVAMFGMLLRNSEHKANSSFAKATALAESAVSGSSFEIERRKEFIQMLETAESL